MPRNLQTIDDVIATLEEYIAENIAQESPLGYFPALYLKVTRQVKKGIAEGFFENGPRMERLDVLFASRYIHAYDDYKNGAAITQSWLDSFQLTENYWPIVLQHLLMGMNAHINLDLGIAAAEVMEGQNIEKLQTDFNRINQILSDLVGQVQDELAAIWPRLHWILRKTGRIDDHLVDFSMQIARDGAWRFARELAASERTDWDTIIAQRDIKVARYGQVIQSPGWVINLALMLIRIGERGSVAEKIRTLDTGAVP